MIRFHLFTAALKRRKKTLVFVEQVWQQRSFGVGSFVFLFWAKSATVKVKVFILFWSTLV